MESIGVFLVCISVFLGTYYKRDIVNNMLSTILGRRRRRVENQSPNANEGKHPLLPSTPNVINNQNLPAISRSNQSSRDSTLVQQSVQPTSNKPQIPPIQQDPYVQPNQSLRPASYIFPTQPVPYAPYYP
uniref:Uncharacterized protein n=1 Tax=Strongyloides papillosus TaxID=174720 RepID=A0A0N5CH85_STREA